MTIDLKSLTQSALNTVFSLGGDFVKDGTYLRPPSLATPTGIVAANEISVPVKLVIGRVATPLATEPEKLIIRASELTAITVPAAGDYIIETATGQRRDVISAALDPSAKFYTFTTRRSRHEDHGDLVAHTSSEDWGDLIAASEIEDRGALYE